MISLDYAALGAATLQTDPFKHLLVRHFVPPEALRAVISDLPPIAKGGSFPLDAVRLGQKAQDLAMELQGEGFRQAISTALHLDLAECATMITVRGQSRAEDGRIHRDSAAKRVTVLLYLNEWSEASRQQAGCLRLLRGGTDLENYAVEVAPTDGTLLVFANGPDAWHGHKPFIGQRYVIQLNYMSGGRAARYELGRHRLSAAIKRLIAA